MRLALAGAPFSSPQTQAMSATLSSGEKAGPALMFSAAPEFWYTYSWNEDAAGT